MAFPPPVLAVNRTNATPSTDTHPQDHNGVNQAVNDTVTELQRVTGNLVALGGQVARHGVFRGTSGAVALPAGATTDIVFPTLGPDQDPDGYTWGGHPSNAVIPNGLGGVYVVELEIGITVGPSAVVIPQLMVAAVARVSPGATQAQFAFGWSGVVQAGQAVSAKVYNGGSATSANVTLSIFRVSM